MGFEHDPTDGAVLYNAAGDVIWSSARLQAYWTDYVTGSFTVPAISGTAGVVSTSTVDLADVSADATDVMGWFTATSSELSGIVSGGTHQLGGTTILRVDRAFEAINLSQSTPGMYPDNLDPRYATYVTSTKGNYSGCIAVSTYVESGKLKATIERYKPLDFSQNFAAMTIEYWAFALRFDT